MNTKNKTMKNNSRLKLSGSGILFAIIFASLIYFKNILPQKNPIILKNNNQTANYQKTIITPELNFLLDNKKKFNLSKKQITQIEKLYKKYLIAAKPIKNQLNNESQNFANFMKQNKNIQVTETKKQAQITSKLSREFYELRKDYWEKSKNFLTQEQLNLIETNLKKAKFKEIQKYILG